MSNKDKTRFAVRKSIRVPVDLLDKFERIGNQRGFDFTKVAVGIWRYGMAAYEREQSDKAA
jgi:hypothetical protein